MSKYTTVPIGDKLLSLADSFVYEKDSERLKILNGILVELILHNIDGGKVSLVEIGEFIGEALALLKKGETAEVIKHSSIRRMLGE